MVHGVLQAISHHRSKEMKLIFKHWNYHSLELIQRDETPFMHWSYHSLELIQRDETPFMHWSYHSLELIQRDETPFMHWSYHSLELIQRDETPFMHWSYHSLELIQRDETPFMHWSYHSLELIQRDETPFMHWSYHSLELIPRDETPFMHWSYHSLELIQRDETPFMHWSYHSLELIQRDETHHLCIGVTTLWSWSREMKLITYALELPLFETILSSLLKLHFFPASPSSPSLITLDTLPVWWSSNGPMQSDPCCCMHNWWTVMGAKAHTLSYAPMSIIQVWPASMTTKFCKSLIQITGSYRHNQLLCRKNP